MDLLLFPVIYRRHRVCWAQENYEIHYPFAP
jgi:hypothetical protein